MSAQHWWVSIAGRSIEWPCFKLDGWVSLLCLSAHAHGRRQEELGRRLGEFRAHVAELKAMGNTNELQKRKVRRRS